MISAVVSWAHTVIVRFWTSLVIIGFLVLLLVFGLAKYILKSAENKMSSTKYDEGIKQQSTLYCNGKKPYAAFLVDRPFSNEAQRDENSSVTLMNCLRYRLRIALNLKNSVKVLRTPFSLRSPSPSNSSLTTKDNNENKQNYSVYDALLRLIDEFDATGIAEIYRLLLERRTAIPLFVPQSKKHFLSLLGHISLPGIDNTSLGEEKSLFRIAVISCRQRNQSQTCDILKSVFNIDSLHSHDFTTRNISSENMLAEIGCGCILTDEGCGSQTVQNVLVVHIIGDFRPLWSFLRRFADCYLIEDSTVDSEKFFSSFMTEEKKLATDLEDQNLGVETKKSFGCLWKPSYGETSIEAKEINGFTHLQIQDQLSSQTIETLTLGIVSCMKEISDQPNFITTNRMMLCDIPLLIDGDYSSLACVSPTEQESRMAQLVQNLGNVKKNEFLLQKNFRQQAKHEEAKMEHRLIEEKVREEDAEIKRCLERRRTDTHQVKTNLLLQLFLNLLARNDHCARVLSVRVLEKKLAERGEKELGPLLKEIRILSTSYYAKLSNAIHEKDLDSVREKLHSTKANLIESVLNIEHLWRELSHLYTDMEPERRSLEIQKIPRLAARHLMDGFCLELLDGESNMIHMEWVTKVLEELGNLMKGKRIFVLSVMGVQSSGKSTMLNTMFGIRMRTSVGQCTRGVNMQLLAVEGRPEYDYILLLDTEGTRSPEYHGLAGSEKRDNQMATLSILLSDATIVVIPGENDAAVKEILPIVLMAYQGSKLAEDNGGRLSSRMFFVYNRIDTKQKNKLDTIIQTLGTSLHEAFNQVQQLTGNLTNLQSESPFGNFNLDSSNPCGSDVCILGNVKKQSEPPGDVPDESYGEGLIRFREHIHRRVTNVEGEQIWKSRSIDQFSSYIQEVWKCICSANFTFNFKTVIERDTFDKLDIEFKKIEQKLAEAYLQSFTNVKHSMMELIQERNKSSMSMLAEAVGKININKKDNNDGNNSNVSFEFFEINLRKEISPTEQELNKEVSDVVKKKGREKWSLQFQKMWENNKKDQALNWKLNLINAFNRLFDYERHVEKYKKKMRKEINELFKSSNSSEWTEEGKNKKFEAMFKTFLDEAKKEFPPKDVSLEIEKVYQHSNVIKMRKIEIKESYLTFETKGASKATIHDQQYQLRSIPLKSEASHVSSYSPRLAWEKFSKWYSQVTGKPKKQIVVDACLFSIDAAVNRIVAGKQCYDDTIISNVICDVDSTIISYNFIENSEVQMMHFYGRTLIVQLMQKIEEKWEAENSVFAKFKSSKETMHQYFMMASQGMEKTKLFVATMANTLESVIISAFENEMVLKTFKEIRNERWLYDARIMHKHMDLHLIDLLENQKVSEVLENISESKRFYADVLQQLISQKVPSVEEEWQSFLSQMKHAIEKAALATLEVDCAIAQNFVDQLRNDFLKGNLRSEQLASAFSIDCSDEYEDCDNEEKKEFQLACTNGLTQVLEKQRPPNELEFSKDLSSKVIQFMLTLNDQAVLPRCDACCRLCKSLCIEASNHDTALRPHDAIHQPGGICGFHQINSKELIPNTCNESYENDWNFFLNGDLTVTYKFKNFGVVFPGWKDPRIHEELPLREYVLATFNEEIAKKYGLKPCQNIPAKYSRNLASVKEQLKRDIEN